MLKCPFEISPESRSASSSKILNDELSFLAWTSIFHVTHIPAYKSQLYIDTKQKGPTELVHPNFHYVRNKYTCIYLSMGTQHLKLRSGMVLIIAGNSILQFIHMAVDIMQIFGSNENG